MEHIMQNIKCKQKIRKTSNVPQSQKQASKMKRVHCKHYKFQIYDFFFSKKSFKIIFF